MLVAIIGGELGSGVLAMAASRWAIGSARWIRRPVRRPVACAS